MKALAVMTATGGEAQRAHLLKVTQLQLPVCWVVQRSTCTCEGTSWGCPGEARWSNGTLAALLVLLIVGYFNYYKQVPVAWLQHRKGVAR